MLGLVEPTGKGNLGGDLFAIIWDAKSRKLYGLNASVDLQNHYPSNGLKK
ncbi:MAG: hypothetical protein CM15mP51_20290 [Porticoccaceae bacterium]|nr:MAG: hypothetical protein CM15mP51_20290 [Porticoccaceae bacterium]